MYLADPITGFITTAALVSSKGLSVKVKSITKRMSELRFAAGQIVMPCVQSRKWAFLS